MSAQSDAAKAHIEKLLDAIYCNYQCGAFNTGKKETCLDVKCTRIIASWQKEYQFAKPRRWAFDYAVPAILCAIPGLFSFLSEEFTPRGVIEIDGGTFQNVRTGHSSGVGLRAWREKNNAAMSAGWRVWHYSPEEIIKAGRKIVEGRDNSIRNRAYPTMRNPAR